MSDDPELWCPRCRESYPSDSFFCPRHPGVELVPAPTPAIAEPADPVPEEPRPTCWSCGTRATDARNDTCANCHRSLVPPALVITFPAGSVVLSARRTSAHLGRTGEHGHLFAHHPNVSRSHATVSVDEEGNAWITPILEAPNGTFLNGREIHERSPVRTGDQIRFATDQGPHVGPISESVSQPSRDS
ncbi:FHA domain-containing protein [Micromonospora sp. NPDC050784]|uniref:FHA domain-containing protein n=1 Tax=Micromonospora sp. NPDC050784 TaxID=3364281 RepID=UPI003797307C